MYNNMVSARDELTKRLNELRSREDKDDFAEEIERLQLDRTELNIELEYDYMLFMREQNELFSEESDPAAPARGCTSQFECDHSWMPSCDVCPYYKSECDTEDEEPA